MTTTTDDLGTRGETAAALFVERAGMEILEKNWKTRYGEVDLVALDEEELVFIEVKTRWSEAKGKPEDAVDAQKRKRYCRLATEFVSKHKDYAHYPIRFDVIGITAISDDRALLRHHRSAFVCD